jgi:membrane protease YdiL (CAAX protease family)
VPLLYLAGFVLSRPLGGLLPDWRPDQVDLAGAVIAFTALLITLPWRLRRVWGSTHPWRRLGLALPSARAVRTALMGLARAAGLLGFVSAGLLLSGQAHWAGALPDSGRVGNALLLGCGVGMAEEILFRGWLWGELELVAGRRQALLGQAGVFALVHPWYRAPGLLALSLLGGLTLLGIGLALERRRGNGSLWGASALHGGLVGGWFLLQSGLLDVSPAAPGWWAGPGGSSINPVGGLLGWIGLTVLLVGPGLQSRAVARARRPSTGACSASSSGASP